MPVTHLIFGFLTVLSVFCGTNYYISRRLYQGIVHIFPKINANFYIGIYIFIALIIFLGLIRSFLPISSVIKNLLGRISAYGLGVFMYLLMLFLAADLILMLGCMVRLVASPVPAGIRFFVSVIAVLLTSGLVGYGLYNANQIKQVSYDIKLRETAFSEMNIVLISDLHLGAANSEKHLPEIVARINNQNPDIVCITGDIFDDDYNAIQNPGKAIVLLKGIKSSYGVYASLGNHDGGKTFDEMIEFLSQSNIELLNDEYVIIDNRLILVGRLDPSPIGGFGELKRKDISEILSSVDMDLPIAVMDHTPSNIEQYGSEIALVLSGHTHRGQIFPFNLITHAVYTLDYGHYRKDSDSPHFIVTSGAGTWGPPMRIGSNNEIVNITLR